MILGAVFAGGASSRFGSDKALALLAGRPLIEHVAAALAEACDAVVICGRDHAPWPGLADRPHPGLGPLGALAAALSHAERHGFDRVLTAPCDVPTLAADMLAALVAGPMPAYLAALPLIGVWPAHLAGTLDAYLATTEDRAMIAWARHVGATPRDGPAPPNVNRPGDLPPVA